MLTRISDQLHQKPILRSLFFLGCALLSISLIGYYYGTFDQVIHIPFLKKFIDPTLYPNDTFLDARFIHYSFFWFFFQPAAKAGILEPVMFIVHVLSTSLLFWMIWELSETLFHNPAASFITTFAFIFPHIGMPGFPVIEFSLLNRTFVLPFLLGAVILYLRRKPILAYFLLGLMYNLHVLSVNFVLVMFLLDTVLRIREMGWRRATISFGMFVVGALPILYWRANSTPIDLHTRPDLLDVLSRGLMYTIYYVISPMPQIVFDFLCGLGSLILLIAGFKHQSADPQGNDRIVRNFGFAIGITILAEIICTTWAPVAIILQSQILRIAMFLTIFGYLYFGNWVAELLANGKWSGAGKWIVGVTWILFPFPFIPAAVWAVRRWVLKIHWVQGVTSITLAVLLGLSIYQAQKSWLWAPGLYLNGPQTAWVDAQKWAKENTPKDAVFITPPQLFWHYMPDWRVFSERQPVAELSDLLEIPFNPDYLQIWLPRFEAVAPGALAQFKGDYFENMKIISKAYYSLSDDQILEISKEYHAPYLVVEKPHSRPWPVLYENDGFVIYDLRNIR
jgi:hypothetical protein